MTDDTAPRRVSGSDTRQRGEYIAVRCTVEERAAITAAAERAGMTVGAFMRRQALGTPGPRAARRPVPQKVELAQVLGLLGRAGGNLNQLAKAFNTDGTLPIPADLVAIRADIVEMRNALMRALGHTP